jgi:hypothetical protein
MGILVRSKSSIYGLNADLAALQAADSAEQSRAEAAELVLTNNLATEQSRAEAAELVLTNTAAAIQSELDATQVGAGLATDGSYVVKADASYIATATSLNSATIKLDAALKAEEIARLAAEAALGVRIDNVLSNTDGTAIDSLTEVVTEFQRVDGNLQTAITNLSNAAGAGLTQEIADREAADVVLQGNVDAVAADLATADARAVAAEGVLTADLAQEVSDREAAIAQEVLDRNEAIRVGGSNNKIESRTVASGKITLSFAPKGGTAGIMNFATVRYTDGNGVSYDAPLTAGSSDKEFIVNTDTAGQWDGNSVLVQYMYVTPV